MLSHINTDKARHQEGEAMHDLVAPEDLPSVAKAEQVAVVMQTTVDALAQDRYRDRGIPYVKVGGRVRYLREDVIGYLAANRFGGDALMATHKRRMPGVAAPGTQSNNPPEEGKF
jgi:hypothetical protein